MNERATRHFDREAADLAPRYNSITFEEVHAAVAAYLPARGAQVLDVGAGSGRDARALALLGYRVTAVEPSAVFRWIAEEEGVANITWLNDSLPRLKMLDRQSAAFALILCSAVLMYLPASDIGPSFATMARLLAAEGHLAVSVRDPTPDDLPGLFHRFASEVLIDAAEQAGLELVEERVLGDALGRGNCWRSLVFT
jgi:SAM-dependent methyltransferase